MTEQHDSTKTEQILARVQQGDRASLAQLLTAHRPYMKRIVELRMEKELQARVDPSDIVQETSLVVSRRIDDFLERRPTSFRIWLRRKTLEQIVDARRHHLAQKRSLRRDYRLSDAPSLALARQLLAGRPSQIVRRKESAEQVRSAIDRMSDNDREILLLRHIEELKNAEVAELLEIDPDTARKRHGRAVRRLGVLLAKLDISVES